jgi:hypothetical protein
MSALCWTAGFSVLGTIPPGSTSFSRIPHSVAVRAKGSSGEPVIGFNPIPDSAKDKKAKHERTRFFKRGGEID